MQLIFERIVPYHSRGCIECSLSAFRKLKTPLAETTAQSRFSRRRFCLRVLSIKKKKKNILGPRMSSYISRLLETPSKSLNFEIQCVRQECRKSHVARKFRDLLISSVFLSFSPFLIFLLLEKKREISWD